MKTISLVMLFALTFAVTCMPTPEEDSRDIIDTLMPMFGKNKLSKIISQRSIDFVKRFFDINPRYYESIKNAMTPEGVFMPEQDDMKWDTAKPEDFETLIQMVGDATFADAVTDKKFLQNIVDEIESDPALIARLESRVKDAGITWNDDVDIDSIGRALTKQLTTGLLASFAPIAMQIMWFGKRSVEMDRADILELLGDHIFIPIWNFLGTDAGQFVAAILGKRSVEKINIQQIVQHIKPHIQTFIAQHQSVINQVMQSSFVKQIIQKVQQFLASKPQIYQLINQQLAAFGVQLPRLDIDWMNLATTILPSLLPSLIGLIGKRSVEMDRADILELLGDYVFIPFWNFLNNGGLSGMIGKRSVEIDNILDNLVSSFLDFLTENPLLSDLLILG